MQTLKQSERVWKWAIEDGNGKAWVYYILAVCQWLPTNYRLNKHDPKAQSCNFCLLGEKEDMAHLLVCPALSKEHRLLNDVMQRTLRRLQVPFVDKNVQSREAKHLHKWEKTALRAFQHESLLPARLNLLCKGFWESNKHKQFISTRQFILDLEEVLNVRVPSLPIVYCPCGKPIAPLIHDFCLQTHCATDILEFFPHFGSWTSEEAIDTRFGARLLGDLSGCNAFYFGSPSADQKQIETMMERFELALQSKQPTRYVCLVPHYVRTPQRFLELARPCWMRSKLPMKWSWFLLQTKSRCSLTQ